MQFLRMDFLAVKRVLEQHPVYSTDLKLQTFANPIQSMLDSIVQQKLDSRFL